MAMEKESKQETKTKKRVKLNEEDEVVGKEIVVYVQKTRRG